MEMSYLMILWLVCTGFASVSGNECDTTEVKPIVLDFLQYRDSFPYIGGITVTDSKTTLKLELVKWCRDIPQRLEVIKSFYENCGMYRECGEDCRNVRAQISNIIGGKYVQKLFDYVCKGDVKVFSKYVEHAKCLQNNAHKYAACRNTTNMYYNFLYYLPEKQYEMRIKYSCCLSPWIKECYKKGTEPECGEKAASFVLSMFRRMFPDMPQCRGTVCDGLISPPDLTAAIVQTCARNK